LKTVFCYQFFINYYCFYSKSSDKRKTLSEKKLNTFGSPHWLSGETMLLSLPLCLTFIALSVSICDNLFLLTGVFPYG
jgi:hypothetical protein